MKKLYLVRHAKSSWKDNGLTDMERPLEKRGKKNASNISLALKNAGIRPQLMVSSPAVRAMKTANIFAKAFDIPKKEIQVVPELYLPDFPTLLQTCTHLPDLSDVMVFGHEPSYSEAIHHFLPNALDKVRTSSATELVFDATSWTEISAENLRQARHWHRKNLEGIQLRQY